MSLHLRPLNNCGETDWAVADTTGTVRRKARIERRKYDGDLCNLVCPQLDRMVIDEMLY